MRLLPTTPAFSGVAHVQYIDVSLQRSERKITHPMMKQNTFIKRWNLFARELEDILARRRLRLEQLGDQIAIIPEKVRRLSQSLLKPKLFPVLNDDELIQVTQAYGLSPIEVTRLRAAILASSIEKMLMERINQDDALLAAEQLFPTIFNALQLDTED